MSTDFGDLTILNVDRTVRSQDFTMMARKKIREYITSEDCDAFDPDQFFSFLYEQMTFVPFGDQLKRYVYRQLETDEPFEKIPENDFVDVILNAFRENNAPFSMQQTSTRPAATIRGWLRNDSARRSSVFLLGFGLQMPDTDVSSFLTKVLRESDFDFTDPEETVWWYCFHFGLHYADGLALLEKYHSKKTGTAGKDVPVPVEQAPLFIRNEKKLMTYLAGIDTPTAAFQKKQQVFENLLDKVRIMINPLIENPRPDGRATNADIERELYSYGIEKTSHGNLKKTSSELMKRYFHNYRLTRQRIDQLLNHIVRVERFDLITLMFCIYAHHEDSEPKDRVRAYLREINPMLESCGMSPVYLVNPYETFILICLLNDIPMELFWDVLETANEEE